MKINIDEMRKELISLPFDKRFPVEDGRTELCPSTGYEVFIDGEWWNEYEDSYGNLHYGR